MNERRLNGKDAVEKGKPQISSLSKQQKQYSDAEAEADDVLYPEQQTEDDLPLFRDIIDFASWQEQHFVIALSNCNTLNAASISANTAIAPRATVAITFTVTVYNEENRIRHVVEHALRWADEVLIINKSSTDKTKDICAEYGDRIRVVDVPFTPKGNDDTVSFSKLARNDWIFFGTASEVPTFQLIERCKQ